MAEQNQQLLNASQQNRPPFPTPPAVESAWNRMQDWRGRAAAEPAAGHWRVDFVTQLAQSEPERNPTAKLKIAAAGIKSVISALPSLRR